MKETVPKLVVFYDGDCGFCNRAVQFVLKNDRQAKIHFAALQSEWAFNFFRSKGLVDPDMSTFYFWNGSRLFERSTAAIQVLRYLRFPLPLGMIFVLVPRGLRDWCYNQIARRRHRIQSGFCVVPSAEQRERFLKN